MKKIFALSILVLCLSIPIKIRAQSTIEWSRDYKLKWSDFKAEADTTILAFANTVYKIEILPTNVSVDSNNHIQNYEALTAVAQFYTKLSWVYEEDDNLLKHEQLHFDIAELYARKLRIEFGKLKQEKIANFNTYSAAYNKLWTECKALQMKYDSETNHGILIEQNQKWENDIIHKLNSIKSIH